MCVSASCVCVDPLLCAWTYLQRHAVRDKDGEEEPDSHAARPIIIIIVIICQQNSGRLQLKKAHPYTYPKPELVWSSLQERSAQTKKCFRTREPSAIVPGFNYTTRKGNRNKKTVQSIHFILASAAASWRRQQCLRYVTPRQR